MYATDQIRILYADHDIDSREMLIALLGFDEICVSCADGVKDALYFARTTSVDLYLLATRFEDGTGIELCRALRAISPGTPIAFYSGDVREADKQAALSAGADAYLTKPDSDDIASTITSLTKRRNTHHLGLFPTSEQPYAPRLAVV